MAFNPFTPPVDIQGSQGGAPMAWEPNEVMGTAWSVFKMHWGTLVGATVIAGMIQSLISNVVNRLVGVALGSPAADPEHIQQLMNGENLQEVLQPLAIQGAIATLVLYPVTAYFRAG